MEAKDMLQVLYQCRFVVVIALLGVAAVLATAKGRLPLALRGLKKVLRKDLNQPVADVAEASRQVAPWRRFLALVLVLLAFLIAVI